MSLVLYGLQLFLTAPRQEFGRVTRLTITEFHTPVRVPRCVNLPRSRSRTGLRQRRLQEYEYPYVSSSIPPHNT